jgi:hypothetical protein
MRLIREAERMRKVANLTPRASSSPRMAWVVTFCLSDTGSDEMSALYLDSFERVWASSAP